MKTTKEVVAITETMVRTNAKTALENGVSVKRVKKYLEETGYRLVAWESVCNRTYCAVEPIRELIGVEFEPDNISREVFIKCVQRQGRIVEI